MRNKVTVDGDNRQCRNILGEEKKMRLKKKKKDVRVDDVTTERPPPKERQFFCYNFFGDFISKVCAHSSSGKR